MDRDLKEILKEAKRDNAQSKLQAANYYDETEQYKEAFRWYVDGFYIESIDNFYVALFIRYAYPGMITYILIIIRALISLVRTIFYAHSGTCKVLLCSLLCYFINLWWLDTLQTIKYAYIVIALFYIYVSKMQKK